jgi:hypothetical protein
MTSDTFNTPNETVQAVYASSYMIIATIVLVAAGLFAALDDIEFSVLLFVFALIFYSYGLAYEYDGYHRSFWLAIERRIP